ncbi:hypothetical protein ACQPZU_17935 [Saccharomonospora azurea]|uniref:hypothetical protein n=1 Tax=Saccharomonospora azurea TaxID=40988 RepID=UPI003D903DBD
MRTHRKAALCALAAATLLGTAALPASAAGSGRVDFTLTVLFTSDMESALLGVPGGEDGTPRGRSSTVASTRTAARPAWPR